MKKFKLLSIFLITASFGFAQNDIVAVSGKDSKQIQFNDFRFLDVDSKTHQTISKKNYTFDDQVVGMTMDIKQENLVFIGKNSPDIFTYNLNNQSFNKIYSSGKSFSNCDLGKQFSRMTTDIKGVMYALNNNSTQLISIELKNGVYKITDLGALRLSSSNESLNNMKFFGGDLIADKSGNLYLISAFAEVLMIDPNKKTAHHLGKIKGIETNFATNGAAVTKDNLVALSNSEGKGMYIANFSNFEAKKIMSSSQPLYDMASPYFLDLNKDKSKEVNGSIYPTKLTQKKINISIDEKINGKGEISIYNINGNKILSSSIQLNKDGKSFKELDLSNLKAGNYIIVVSSPNGEELINEKFMILR